MKDSLLVKEVYLRNFVFGVEDSLVSTLGLLSGIAVADVPRSTIILTGIVLIFVESISMGAGSYLSEASAEEYAEHSLSKKRSLWGGLIMLVSYFIAGFIPLAPYMISSFLNPFAISIILTLLALFLLGVISAEVSGTNIWKKGARMLIVAGAATLTGILVGKIFEPYL